MINKYIQEEREQALRELRKEEKNMSIGALAGGTALYGGSHLFLKSLDNKEKNILQHIGKIKAHEAFTGSLPEKMEKELIEKEEELKKIQRLRGLGALGKTIGVPFMIGGAANYLIGTGSRYLDKGRQGIIDDKTLEGKRDNYLLGVGALLAGLGLLGHRITGRKIKEAITDFTKLDKGTANELKQKARDIKKYRNFQNADEYENLKDSIKDSKDLFKQHLKNHGISDNTLRFAGFSQGLMNMGLLGMGSGLLGKLNSNRFDKKIKEIRKRKLEKRASDMMEKRAFFESALLAHILQNIANNALIKNKFMRDKLLAEYIAKSFKEGLHGKSYDSRIVRAIGSGATSLIPELGSMRLHFRELGSKLREEGVDFKNFDEHDKAVWEGLAKGDLHKVIKHLPDSKNGRKIIKTIVPGMSDQLIIAGGVEGRKATKQTIDKLQEIYRQTNTQKILESVHDYMNKTKLKDPTHSLKGIDNIEKATGFLGDAAMIAGDLSPMHIGDTGTGAWNAARRIIGNPPLEVKPAKNARERFLNNLKHLYNLSGKVGLAVTKAGQTMSTFKGAMGKKVNPISHFTDKWIINPVFNAQLEDAYHYGRMLKTQAEATDIPEEAKKALAKKIKKLKDFSALSYSKKLWHAFQELNKSNGEGWKMLKILSKDPKKQKEAEDIIRKKVEEGIKKNQDKIEEAAGRAAGKARDIENKAIDETSKLKYRIKKWQLPGYLAGGTVLAAPAMYGIYKRNTNSKKERRQ